MAPGDISAIPRNHAGNLMACPQCGSPNVHKPSYTWWGGILGPLVFNHHVCNGCGLGFNGKSGKSNKPAITIYLCVSVGLVVLVIIAQAL
jgi:transposase-like protein